MTGQEFSGQGRGRTGPGLPPRDFYRLADYVGGALTGTPAASEVARLVREDPVWRDAHAELAAATAAVTADLAAWGRLPAAMPEGVAARLDAALADRDRLSDAGAGAGTGAGTRDEDERPPQPRRRLSVVPGDAGAGPRRRPHPRWAAPLVAAAAVVVAVGLGLQVLPSSRGGSGSEATSSGESAQVLDEPGDAPAGGAAPDADRRSALPEQPVRQLVTSGVDYRRDTLAAAAAGAAARPPRARVSSAPQVTDAEDARLGTAVPDPLRRLAAPAALSDCLSAIGGGHPRAAGSVELIDYASFEGAPALIIVFVDTAGDRWAYAVGPACGLGNAGADTRYRAQVG